MAVVGSAQVLIRPSFQGFQTDVNKQIPDQGKKAGGLFGGTFGKWAVRGVAAGAAAVGSVIGATLVKGFGRLRAIENAEAKLRGLGHTADGVKSIMKDALAAVKGTAFGMDEAATVAATAVAAGVKPGKELEGYLKLVADAATIAGTDMSEMGDIINKVTTQGKVGTENLNQLAERGIPIFQWLAEHYGVSAMELRKMVTAGKVDAETYRKVIAEKIGGAALESGTTTEGAWKNVGAAMSRVGANLLSGVYPMFKTAANSIMKALGPVEDRAADMGLAFGNKLASAIKIGISALKAIGSWFKSIDFSPITNALSIFREQMSVIAASAMPMFKQAGAALIVLFNALKPAIKVVATMLGATFIVILKAIPPTLSLLIKGITALSKAIIFLEPALKVIGILIAGMAGLITGLTIAFYAARVALTLWGVAVKIATAVQWLWNAALNMNPLGLLILGIVAVVAAIAVLWKRSETFRTIVLAVWGAIKKAASAVVSWFTGTALPALKGALAAVIGFFKGVAAWVSSVVNAIKGAFSAVVGFFAAIPGKISGVWNSITGATSTGVSKVSGVFSTLGSAVSSVFNNMRDAIMNVWSKYISPILVNMGIGFRFLGQMIKKVYDGYISPVFQLMAAIIVWLATSIVKVHVAAIRKLWSALGAGVRLVYAKMIKPTITGFGNMITWLKKWFAANVATVRAVWTATGKLIKSVYDKTIKPIIKAFKTAWDLARKGFQTVGKLIRAAWSATADYIRKRYNSVIKPIITAFRTAIDALRRWFSEKVKAIRIAWSNTATAIKTTFTKKINVIFTRVRNAITAVKNTVSTATGLIKSYWTSMANHLRTKNNAIMSKVWTSIKTGLTGVRGAFSKAVPAIKAAWDKVQRVAAAPVKFVIETVINRGLLRGFNALARTFGTKEVEWIKLPAGFSHGGVLAGRSSWRNGDSVPIMARPGEGWTVSEAMDQYETNRLLALNAATLQGKSAAAFRAQWDGQHFAKGGTVQPVPGHGNRHGSGYGWATWAGDFPVAMGTPIRSWKDGIVAMVREMTTSYGKHVRVNHTDGTSSLYAHMSRIAATVGAKVAAGSILGYVGSTGNSTGPHLHFETMGGPYKGGAGGDGLLSGVLEKITSFKNKVTAPIKEIAKRFGDNAFVQMLTAAPTKLLTAAGSKLTTVASSFMDKASGLLSGVTAWVKGKISGFGSDQLNNASTIIDVANKLGFGDRGAIIGLITSLVESNLVNVGYGDRDSVGLFQQRAPWGSRADRMNPAKSASMFFLGGQGGQPGLRSKPWRTMGMGQAAQAVQVSAFPDRYAQRIAQAEKLLDRYKGKGGYANGTLNARRGLAWVGEREPELINFRGGEEVWNSKMLSKIGGRRDQRPIVFGDSYGHNAKEVAKEFFTLMRRDEALHPIW